MATIHTAVALGTFDGVHRGHERIINTLLDEARRIDATPVVVTFFPHPSHVLTPGSPLKLINSLDERLMLIRSKGVSQIHVETFTREFSALTASEYVTQTLIGELKMKSLIIGYDHRFGKDKGGGFEELSALGGKLGFRVIRVPALLDEQGEIISSTRIRKLLTEGRIEAATRLLGHDFCLFGTVVRGNRLGRKIGFETANIVLDYDNKIIPAHGVYIVRSTIDGAVKYGMMNIGNRPTVDGKTRTIEVHFLNTKSDLYDRKIRITLLHRIRDELKFSSLDELKEQLQRDKIYTLEYLNQPNR